MTEPIKWSDAPDRTSWGASMRVADIEIDKDHTLTLFCEADQTAKVDAMFAAAEREAIARMFDGAVWGYDYREIAAAIRARGEK
jgi:hypothetical protein